MKIILIQSLYANPFAGLDHEDPNRHLTKFSELSRTLGATEEEEEEVFMQLFPQSLTIKYKELYLDQPTQVMINWNILKGKKFNMFFPYNKFKESKPTLIVFFQGSTKTLCEAWVRYIFMMQKCLNHGFDDLTQIPIFRNWIPATKVLLYVIVGGSLM